jgi:beta-N-acetylhexosaminidase
VVTENEFSTHGETLITELRRSAKDLRSYLVNESTPDSLLSATAADALANCKRIYAAAFVTVAANRGSVGLQGGLTQFLQKLVHGGVPIAIISLGNPYLLRDFPDVGAYAATFSSTSSSEESTAKAILGEISITGKMPVTIPGLVKLGDGLNVPARHAMASNGLK